MISFNLETRNRNINAQEVLLDGELHLRPSLDDLVEGEGGGDGNGGPGVKLKRVRQDGQLVNGPWLRSSLYIRIISNSWPFIVISPQNPYSISLTFRLLALRRTTEERIRRSFIFNCLIHFLGGDILI